MSREHALQDDVGFLKRLAAQGRGEPAPLAWLLALFGLVYGTVFLTPFGLYALFSAGVIERKIVPPISQALFLTGNIVFGLGLLGAAAQIWATRHSRPRVNTVALATWVGAFVALVTVAISFALLFMGARGVDFPRHALLVLTVAAPVVILTLYGMAWWVAASVTDRKWLFLVALGSFAAAIVMAAVPGLLVLTGAVALLLLAFVPGLMLALSARRTKVVAS